MAAVLCSRRTVEVGFLVTGMGRDGRGGWMMSSCVDQASLITHELKGVLLLIFGSLALQYNCAL